MMLKSKFIKLNDRSKQILSVFTKTVSDLTVLNDDIFAEVEERNIEAFRLQKLVKVEEDKAAQLTETADHNQKVIDKVTAFLED